MKLVKLINSFPGGWCILIMIALFLILWIIPNFIKPNNIVTNNHIVTHLPGYDAKLPSNMYSGYIPTHKNSKMIHYWLIESENDPENDPLLLWLQGGPGSSGMIGLLTEMGPFRVNENSFNVKADEPLKVFRNNNTWTKFSNMLFIESPAGVGYSYFVDGVNKVQTDESVAEDTAEFLENFFELYPKYKKNPFYLTGESYAGIYIPTLSFYVLKMKDINFAGVAVGNGCTGLESEGGCGKDYNYWYLNKLWGHGQVSTSLYNEIINSCVDYLKGNAELTEECNALIYELNTQVGGFDIYQIYDECYGDDNEAFNGPYYLSLQQKNIHKIVESNIHILNGAVNNYPCGTMKAMTAYLANPEVAKALHCKIDYSKQPFRYKSTEKSVFKYYNDLLDAGKKVLIFYGDTDVIVPSNGGEFWTHNMGLEIVEPWRSWTPIENSLWTAGHIVKFEKDFTFLTVKGAGHMVPTFKPEAAFYMMYFWLNDMDFPTQTVDINDWPSFFNFTNKNKID